MELTNEQKKSQELLQKIIFKAWEDEVFMKDLLVNPLDAIEKATGEKVYIPEDKTLIVTNQTSASTIYINIPAEPNMDDIELNEEQLEFIAGGGVLSRTVLPTLPTKS